MKPLPRLWRQLWPFPAHEPAYLTADFDAKETSDMAKIAALADFNEADAPLLLEAARRVAEEEDRRKSGAEARATAFIAAIATLIPLMTWALTSLPPVCSKQGTPCVIWNTTFTVAVIYFVMAAYWSLRSLEVSTFRLIGVEDLLRLKVGRLPVIRGLIKETLASARTNRETINKKLTFIRVAQRSFFNGLVLLAVLLACDPWIRVAAQAAK
jgi:hypothetical protein